VSRGRRRHTWAWVDSENVPLIISESGKKKIPMVKKALKMSQNS
jgi:hypothetical protein